MLSILGEKSLSPASFRTLSDWDHYMGQAWWWYIICCLIECFLMIFGGGKVSCGFRCGCREEREGLKNQVLIYHLEGPTWYEGANILSICRKTCITITTQYWVSKTSRCWVIFVCFATFCQHDSHIYQVSSTQHGFIQVHVRISHVGRAQWEWITGSAHGQLEKDVGKHPAFALGSNGDCRITQGDATLRTRWCSFIYLRCDNRFYFYKLKSSNFSKYTLHQRAEDYRLVLIMRAKSVK